jgi:hypothetical protein
MSRRNFDISGKVQEFLILPMPIGPLPTGRQAVPTDGGAGPEPSMVQGKQAEPLGLSAAEGPCRVVQRLTFYENAFSIAKIQLGLPSCAGSHVCLRQRV